MDRITYLLVTEPGGEDGRDHRNQGGEVVLASFSEDEVKARKGQDSRYRIEKIVLTVEDARARALSKLNPVDRLVLGL